MKWQQMVASKALAYQLPHVSNFYFPRGKSILLHPIHPYVLQQRQAISTVVVLALPVISFKLYCLRCNLTHVKTIAKIFSGHFCVSLIPRTFAQYKMYLKMKDCICNLIFWQETFQLQSHTPKKTKSVIKITILSLEK